MLQMQLSPAKNFYVRLKIVLLVMIQASVYHVLVVINLLRIVVLWVVRKLIALNVQRLKTFVKSVILDMHLIFIVMNVQKRTSAIVLLNIYKSIALSVRKDIFDQTVGLTALKLVRSTIVKHVKVVIITCAHPANKVTNW